MCVCWLVGWVGGLEEERESRAERRAVRGYREGVLVGALVEGVGIVVHARCRGQLGLGFWRSSELIGARWSLARGDLEREAVGGVGVSGVVEWTD